MERVELQASKREVLGKKVRFLRRRGIIPANLYGHGVPSEALQVDARTVAEVLRHAGLTRLIDLQIQRGRPRPVLVRSLQRNPRTGEILHVDFYQVSMREKLRLHVPVVIVGDAPALKNTDGILVRNLDTIEVEALPGDLPPTIEVDVSHLNDIGDTVTVGELRVPERVTILAHAEDPVVTIAPPMAEELEKVTPEEQVEAPAEEEAAAEERAEEERGEK
ncbi:MAG: 50S ribosomal protein L25 [Chloroflexota bacterium]